MTTWGELGAALEEGKSYLPTYEANEKIQAERSSGDWGVAGCAEDAGVGVEEDGGVEIGVRMRGMREWRVVDSKIALLDGKSD
jgi:hypothetical protein